VTDCARLSVVFKSASGLDLAARHVLDQTAVATFKNRVAHPTPECYRDLLFTITLAEGHVCEVQMHLAQVTEARQGDAGPRMHKICRRVLTGPSVQKDTYCREIKDGAPEGEGELNAAGQKEGAGTMVFASGGMYIGQWKADQMDGAGTYYFASGSKYVGPWKADKMEGEEGMYYFLDGSRYVGSYKASQMDGHGTRYYADGNRYVGGFQADKKEGSGDYYYANGDTFTGTYTADKKEGAECTYFFAGTGTRFVGGYRADKRDGAGTFFYKDGTAEVCQHSGGEKSGEGAKWSVDRTTAWRLRAGKIGDEISLDEAAQIAERVGRPVPDVLAE